MNIKKILIFSLFFSFCSPSANEGIVSLSNETTTTLIVAEEDYPIVLTQCLNEEKGYKLKLQTKVKKSNCNLNKFEADTKLNEKSKKNNTQKSLKIRTQIAKLPLKKISALEYFCAPIIKKGPLATSAPQRRGPLRFVTSLLISRISFM